MLLPVSVIASEQDVVVGSLDGGDRVDLDEAQAADHRLRARCPAQPPGRREHVVADRRAETVQGDQRAPELEILDANRLQVAPTIRRRAGFSRIVSSSRAGRKEAGVTSRDGERYHLDVIERNLHRVLAAAALAVLVGCSPPEEPSFGSDWPQWRGPDRSGVSTETGLLETWPPEGLEASWVATGLGRGFSSVAVADGVVYTMGQRDDAEWTIALDARDGSELWATRTGESFDSRRGDGPRATPTVVDDLVYSFGPDGDLWALSTEDGAAVWHLNVLERFDGKRPSWGLSESPLVDGDLVIVATGSSEGSIVAFDRHDGTIVWQSAGMTDRPGYASAVIADVGGVRQAIYFTDESLNGIRLDDGRPLWRYERVANTHANCATPVVHDNHVLATSSYDTGAALLRLEPDGDGTRAEEVWFTREMKNQHGGVVLVDDHVYGFDNEILTCLDWRTGERKWRHRSMGKGALTAADGLLYVLTERGTLVLIEANPERYVERAKMFVETAKSSWAYPVISGGRLYVRIHDQLRCFDIRV
jgi:outer membrane protein assembly factor BamB